MCSSTRFFSWVAAACVLVMTASAAGAQVLRMEEMNTEQLRAVDKAKTVVVIPLGILEEHGPYLPAYTDGFAAGRAAQLVAEAIVEKGWTSLMFPQIPLGAGGVNEVAAKYPFPGTYPVRAYTLRSIFMDLADELGEHGFKWIFVINSHGAPNHNRILDQAGKYFADTYKGQMLQINGRGMPGTGDDPSTSLSEQARKEDASSGHGGINETSQTLFLRPDLVDSGYTTAPSFTVQNGDMIATAKLPNWRGYFGAPKYASAEYGAKLFKTSVARRVQQAFAVIEGKVTTPAPAQAPTRQADEASPARDARIEQRQQDWLKKNGYR